MTTRRVLLLCALFTMLTAVMTWPQAAHMTTDISDPGDPLLNTWAQAWVLHQLPRDPLHLFDGNIFFPERYTLAYSESLIVPALLTAPVRWAGGSPLLAYNVSLCLAFVLSGVATALLVHHLTGSSGAGVLAGVVFAFLPFRFDHYAHLQLQWAAWIPFALLALHRFWERSRASTAVWFGLAIAAQVLSCLYHAIFFSSILGVLLIARIVWSVDVRAVSLMVLPRMRRVGLRPLLALLQAGAILYLGLAWWVGESGFSVRVLGLRIRAHEPIRLVIIGAALTAAALCLRRWGTCAAEPRAVIRSWPARARLRGLVLAAVVAGALCVPVAAAYVNARSTVGERSQTVIGGAVPTDYLAAAIGNRLYGDLARRFGGPEHVLFPGLLPVGLAIVALCTRRSAIPWIYAGATVLAFDLSLGFTGLAYEWLYRWVLPFRALRVASRAGLLVGFGLAVLAGLGSARLLARLSSTASRAMVAAVLCAVSIAEAWTVRTERLARLPVDAPPVYTWLAGVTPSANIVELPAGPRNTLYMYYSTLHWHRLLNGYSGFFPPSYIELEEKMRVFPRPETIAYLRDRQVDYLVDHAGRTLPDPAPPGIVLIRAFDTAGRRTLVYRILK